MHIKSIHIKYFRSIYNQKIDLDRLNIFVGLNDAGKSNILKALNLFFNGYTGWNEPFIFKNDFNVFRKSEFQSEKRIKKAKEIEIIVTIGGLDDASPIWKKKWREDGTFFEELYDENISLKERKINGNFKKNSKSVTKIQKIQYEYIPAFKGNEFISYLIGRVSDAITKTSSDDILHAATGFEEKLKDYLDAITGDIKAKLAIDSLLKMPRSLTKIFESMEFSDQSGVILSQRGDGIRTRHIPILLEKISLYHDEYKKLNHHFIWGYEEPENNVEMNACFEMADQFWENYSNSHQILLTTHSPAFYSLPERHSENWSQGNDQTYRYYAENTGSLSDKGTTYIDVIEEDLDKHFLLPATARLLKKEREEREAINQEILAIKNDLNGSKNPAIIVEGESDGIVLNKALNIFFPKLKDQIQIIYPKGAKNGGGAGFVKNRLIAWEHLQIHAPDNERVKAYGLFDNDEEGNKDYNLFLDTIAANKTSKKNKDPVHTKASFYHYEDREENHFKLLQNSKLKAKLPVVLEHLYSPSFWELALEKKWLFSRKKFEGIIDTEVLTDIVYSGKSLPDILNEIQERLYVSHSFSSHDRATREYKIEAAKFIAKASEKNAREYLYLFVPIIQKALNNLKVRVE